jgi:hypothetical protein
MGLLDSFLRRPPRVPRCVHVYVSADKAIVAAMHRNLAGIYYEQAAPVVLVGPSDAATLGAAFKRAFDGFSVKDANLRQHKRSDWPAYKASGLRTLKDFEARFRHVSCSGLDDANMIVQASTAHPGDKSISLNISFNPALPPSRIGEHLMQLLAMTDAREGRT